VRRPSLRRSMVAEGSPREDAEIRRERPRTDLGGSWTLFKMRPRRASV
jgi:hypothetical protein